MVTRPRSARTTLSLKLGNWLEAYATGWGVAAIPLVIVLILGAALAGRLLA